MAAFRHRRSAVPYADLPALRGPARRTRFVRVAVALALAGLLTGAAIAAGGSHKSRSDIAPDGSTSVLVIDLSKSIVDNEFRRIGGALRRLIETDTSTGLVVFSDGAYELLPPGSPASALVPVLRFFTPVRGAFPDNPWQTTFRAGTQISTALELARDMLRRDRVGNGSIVLISDLETAPSDFVMLTQTLTQLRSEGVPVRVVPLQTTQRGRNLFRSLLGPSYLLPEPRDAEAGSAPVRQTLARDVPVVLMVLGGLLLLGLAANERWCTRLALPWTDSRRRA